MALNTMSFTRKSGPYNISDLLGKERGRMDHKKTAVISGAGIAGLAAAFELNAKGFNVVVAEKREEFSRFNVINLNKEAQAFLRKFNLLEEFEDSVAGRIENHQVYCLWRGRHSTGRNFTGQRAAV